MEKSMASVSDREIFRNLTSKISHLFIERSEGDWKLINKTLEDLNLLNYRYSLVENPIKAVLLINHCCSFIPVDEEILIPKCCRLITNLLNWQKVVVEGRTLTIAIQWCLQILSNSQKKENITLDVLVALDALLRSNTNSFRTYISDIVSADGPILALIESDISPEILRYSLQCIESCTIVQEDLNKDEQEKFQPYFDRCASIFLKYLSNPKILNETADLKIHLVCLRGLGNIVLQNNKLLLNRLGLLLGIAKSFMLLGLKNIDFLQPQTLLPSSLSIPEPPVNGIREKKGGKVTKQRKHRISKKDDNRKSEEWMKFAPNSSYAPASTSADIFIGNTTQCCPISRLVTSESDFSDTEINKDTNVLKLQSRVRQMALSLLFTVAKKTDKITMFSYWSSFIPENSLSGKHYLTTCILEDSSPKGRTAALSVLLYLLTSSKLYLFQAESSSRSNSFTPFSVILGYMLIELHHYLSLALSEKVVSVLAQVLKCYAALVQATPYHRLNPGLVTKVVRSMRHFVQYKDATIQVGALIVLGCILSSEPITPETKGLFLKTKNSEAHNKDGNQVQNTKDDEDFKYAEFSSDEEDEDTEFNEKYKAIPWVLERCLTNLGVIIADTNALEQAPAPVKLESIQVISSMCGNYFDSLVYPYLTHISRALDDCLSDKYTDLKLHAGRTIDTIGQSMEQYLNGLGVCSDEKVAPGLTFWQTLLNGSLTSLLQSEEQASMKAVGCDSLGSIGAHIFERLPGDKQILCVTLLFAHSRDEENSVRGAALRALGISVLYPTLREDPGFVVDTAEAVHRSLQDENLGVRIKGSWSLANLSDALVLNSANEDLEELPHSLLLKLLESSITACNDNDRIKMNVVRTIGNLLQLITPDLMRKTKFKTLIESAVHCLIKSVTSGSNMKVRWNTCYAIGNLLKNDALYSDNNEWLGLLFGALNELVINFRNFKVRINAALALSSPAKRQFYGVYYQSIWISLLKALENSQNIDDFTEYQHRDNLVEQICLALGHLISLLHIDDLPSLHESLNLYFDILKSQMKRINDILIPEKSNILFSAAVHLKTFNNINLSTETTKTLKVLKDIFVQEF